MKTTHSANVMKMAILCACCARIALAVDPVISQIKVKQNWPWSRLVNIDYVLTGDATQRVDIAVAAQSDSIELDLPPGSLSGDLYDVQPGARRIVWDPTRSSATSKIMPRFRVSLEPVPVPLYMIVDLTNAVGTLPHIEYVYEEDLVTNKWGTWVRNPVTNAGFVVESVVWTGVTNDPAYRTDKLVLRRIPAGSYNKGGDGYTVYPDTQVKACYAGVFEVTQRQWELVMGSNPSYFMVDGTSRPLERRSYDDIRGATTNVPPVNWPATGLYVNPASFMGVLRAKTGIDDFDLPTETQWEYFCRAGTTTVFHDGNELAQYTGTEYRNNGNTNMYLDVLGRYKWNGGQYWDGTEWKMPKATFGPTNGTAIVGSHLPNAWGLYDTHGNVWEWCLDWADQAETLRMLRSGSWNSPAQSCRATFQYVHYIPSRNNIDVGFRIVRALQ